MDTSIEEPTKGNKEWQEQIDEHTITFKMEGDKLKVKMDASFARMVHVSIEELCDMFYGTHKLENTPQFLHVKWDGALVAIGS